MNLGTPATVDADERLQPLSSSVHCPSSGRRPFHRYRRAAARDACFAQAVREGRRGTRAQREAGRADGKSALKRLFLGLNAAAGAGIMRGRVMADCQRTGRLESARNTRTRPHLKRTHRDVSTVITHKSITRPACHRSTRLSRSARPRKSTTDAAFVRYG